MITSLTEVQEVVKGLAASYAHNSTIRNGLPKAEKLIAAGKVYANGQVESQSRPGLFHQTTFDGVPCKYDCTCEATVQDPALGKICCHCLAQHIAHMANIKLPAAPELAELAPTTKTVWDIFAELIETEALNLWAGESQVIWQKDALSISVHCNQARHLSLVANNGKVTTSKALAINPTWAPAWDWRLRDNARRLYDLWTEQANSHRPLLHWRPAVTELMTRHDIDRDTAVDMYKMKD